MGACGNAHKGLPIWMALVGAAEEIEEGGWRSTLLSVLMQMVRNALVRRLMSTTCVASGSNYQNWQPRLTHSLTGQDEEMHLYHTQTDTLNNHKMVSIMF